MKSERKGYNTRVSTKSQERTRLSDEIRMGELATDVTVGDIINTEEGILCYVYDT